MTRAERRHQEKRTKKMWLMRLMRFPLKMTEDWAAWARKYAPRKAHHATCPCTLCTGIDQQRQRAANRRDRHRARVAVRSFEDDGGQDE